MNRLYYIRKVFLLLLAMVSLSAVTQAQNCKVELLPGEPNNGCYPLVVKMRVVITGTSAVPDLYDWSFGGDGFNQNPKVDSVVAHTFTKIASGGDTSTKFIPSIKVTFKGGSTCNASLPFPIKVWDHPVANILLPAIPIQCFKNNSFCFAQNSQLGKQKWPIVKYTWDLGDGTTDTGNASGRPSMDKGCHHYQSPGFYNVTMTVVDKKGCSDTKKENLKIQVLEELKPKFAITSKASGCFIVPVTFVNTTADTTGYHATKFWWDFGDGSARANNIWGGGPLEPSSKGITHVYNTKGKFTPMFIIETKEGCRDTFMMKDGVEVFWPEIVMHYQDTVCWSQAKAGVTFSVDPMPGALYWVYNFGDPASGPQNVQDWVWTKSHAFAGGPKNYQIHFRIEHPICGTLDTCVALHVMGPQARINIPKPPAPAALETYKPNMFFDKDPYALKKFEDIISRRICDSTLDFSVFTKGSPKTRMKYKYCNAVSKTSKWFNDTLCAKPQYPGYIILNFDPDSFDFRPTDSTVISYTDSVEQKIKFDYNAFKTRMLTGGTPSFISGNELPNENPSFRLDSFWKYVDGRRGLDQYSNPWATTKTRKVYTQSSGILFEQNMHDSDKYSCQFPNLVRFTNNSIKFRLWYNALDDQWPNIDPDTCLSKTWPWSSDSLEYLWDFGDNSGKPCTSTYAVKDWDCKYSTEATPFHFYKDLSINPDRPCYFPKMTVYDPVTKCKDDQTFPILMGAPNACPNPFWPKMNWYIQMALKGVKPRQGWKLTNFPLPCASPVNKFKVTWDETIPGVCEAPNKYWVCFDSAAAAAKSKATKNFACEFGRKHYAKTKSPKYHFKDSVYQWEDTILNYGWMDKPTLEGPPYLGNWWWDDTTTGCKTIGVVIQNADCLDTCWYHNYICFNRKDNRIIILNNDGAVAPYAHSWDTAYHAPVFRPAYFGTPDQTTNFPLMRNLNKARGNVVPWVTSYNASGYPPAARIRVVPRDTTQHWLISLTYQLTRDENAAADYYFTKPFWPDRVSLQSTVSQNDSVNAKREMLYLPSLGAPLHLKDSVWIRYWDPNIPPKGTWVHKPLGGLPALYLKKSEVDSLAAGYNPHIAKGDYRNQYLDFGIDKDPITLYKTPKGKGKVWISDSFPLLNVNDSMKDISTSHDTVTFELPYPGVYEVVTSAYNIDGCRSVTESYRIINGHYAKFTATDSVGCINKPISFEDKVRYFTTDYDIILPHNPLFQHISGVWDELNPWELGPVKGRFNVDSQWVVKSVANPETIAWDFDNDGTIDKVGHNPTWTYKNPGVYTVRMITTDSMGGTIQTIRYNFIKIIKVKSKFTASYLPAPKNVPDTLRFCAPQQFNIYDSTDISSGSGTVFLGRNYFAYMDSVIKTFPAKPGWKTIKKSFPPKKGWQIYAYDSMVAQPYDSIVGKPTIFDSLNTWVWNQGDGRPSIKRTQKKDLLQFTYTVNDTFTMKLAVKTMFGCEDTFIRKQYLVVSGPKPRFIVVGPNKGCLPFFAKVRNLHRKTTASYNWDLHDGTTVTSDSSKEYLDLPYRHLDPKDSAANRDSSVFSITVTETDSVFNKKLNFKGKCSQMWPDTFNSPWDTTFYIIVYRRDTVTINGDTTVCPGVQVTYKAETPNRTGLYKNYSWSASNGDTLSNSDKFNVTFANPGRYRIVLTANHKYCDPKIVSAWINVERVKAIFDVDTSGNNKDKMRLGQFTFNNHSINGVKYEWRFIQDKNDNEVDRTHNADTGSMPIFHNYEENIGIEDGTDLKEYSFRVCLKAISPVGCEDTTCKTITFKRNFEAYNVFTPDGNGINDTYNPPLVGDKKYHIMVFNRWGEKVFESEDREYKWNGNNMNDGKPCPAGTYFYILTYDLIGKTAGTGHKQGTITLIR